MTVRILLAVLLLIGYVGITDADAFDGLELRLFRVYFADSESGRGGPTGIKILYPRRNFVRSGAIPSKLFPSDEYVDPIALLQVRNTSDHPLEIEKHLLGSWFANVAVSNRMYRTGVQIVGSCKLPDLCQFAPEEVFCHLLGGFRGQSGYKFRIGYEGKVNEGYAYSNWFSVDDSRLSKVDTVRGVEGIPKFSLHQLAGNSPNVDWYRAKWFDSRGVRNHVDVVVLLENENNYPIRCPVFTSSNWKCMAYHHDGRISRCDTFPQDVSCVDYLCLSAKDCVAVPLVIDMNIEEYRSVDKLKLECNYKLKHYEAELKLSIGEKDEGKVRGRFLGDPAKSW